MTGLSLYYQFLHMFKVCLRFFDAGLGATLQLVLCVARVGKHD